VNDATSVFSQIDHDLSALSGQIGLDEHALKEHKMMALACEDKCSCMLKRVIALEQANKEQVEIIETLEMGLVFVESNGVVDTMRIQCLEECLEDIVSTVAEMSNHLCSCNKEVCVLWFHSFFLDLT